MKPLFIFLVLFGLLIALLAVQFPDALGDDGSKYHLMYMTILLLVVGGGSLASYHEHWRNNLKFAAWWVVIFIVIMTSYAYRDVFLNSKMGAELVPGRVSIQGDGAMVLHARADGHFYINAMLNGQKILFMIDTGATDMMLTKQTAERVGLVPAHNAKKKMYSTANGVSAGVEVRIHRMQIGEVVLRDAVAYINQGDAGVNLLGMQFLKHLSSYSVESGEMTLVP